MKSALWPEFDMLVSEGGCHCYSHAAIMNYFLAGYGNADLPSLLLAMVAAPSALTNDECSKSFCTSISRCPHTSHAQHLT